MRGCNILAPALARAIFNAEDRRNGRRASKTVYEPPRLEANARDDDDWNREWVSVVLDEHNEVRQVRVVPDFGAARSIVGLDAHPALPKWQANTVPWMQDTQVLDPEERRLWRRYERGLRVVQVGDATRPLTSGEYFDREGTRALVDQLHEAYGEALQTGITTKAVEDDLESLLAEHVDAPATMHYGEEKSRNDFADEEIGLVLGCIDPGDGHVLDLLAELDLDAAPERSDTECDHCDGEGCYECDGTGHKRAHGRGFVGEDADTAREILASVRENHTAQAAGRYARNPDDPAATATVFVRTDALPPGFADVQVPGVAWTYSKQQEQVVETLREATGALTAREISTRTDVSKRHVHRTLRQLLEHDIVDALPTEGEHGATLYAADGLPTTGVADVTDDDGQVVTDLVWDSYTWAVAIRPPEPSERDDPPDQPASKRESTGLDGWNEGPDPAG